jgi:hypothetical protein
MTLRSSSKQHSKTTTISRGIRNRVDSNLSVQPPEIPLLKQSRPCRATTSPTPTYNSITSRTSDPRTLSPSSDSEEVSVGETGGPPHSGSLHSTRVHEHSFADLLLSQNSVLNSYALPNEPQRNSGPVLGSPIVHNYQAIQTATLGLPLTPIPPPVPGTINHKEPLSIGQHQLHIPYLELRDMR